jgi:hypothetical protein
MSKSDEPLRGEAAWRAAKKDIADRNEAAYARGRKDRAARNVAWTKRRNEQAREADSHLPKSPRG